jgi:hypothetical protein
MPWQRSVVTASWATAPSAAALEIFDAAGLRAHRLRIERHQLQHLVRHVDPDHQNAPGLLAMDEGNDARPPLALELGDLASPCGIQHQLAARKIGRNSQNGSMIEKVMTASR